MASNEDDDDFGQKLPPLYIYLKRVLDKYPEGGQILKEFVQNADDAGARRVVVVYDKTQHSTATMWSESLHDFNGPCLYVYNDATFQKSDWNNIQHPEQSGKLDDPTKIGRFGLGFISVYHLTDIPSVLSGDQIGFLDPHEKYFTYDPHNRIRQPGKRGKKWRLSADILDQFPDQFNPYISTLFKCSRSSFGNGSFDGTLFRFPLRNSNMESLVSSAVYDDDRIRSLFQSYQADADISLLFLKNVETVELYERNDGDKDPQLLFSISVSEKDQFELRSKRKAFLECVTKQENVSYCCSMNIKKKMFDVDRQGLVSSNSKYLTVNLVKKQDISSDLQNLVVDQDLKLLPWVGVSMQSDDGQQEPIGGRVFCFLPLPESERTGLPIHVHGNFGLGDNRRIVKWPDQESEHDKAAQWNQLLADEAFPDAFVQLINEAIANDISSSTIYRAWPDVSNLNDHWTPGVRNFLNKLRGMPVMYTASNGGAWMKPEDVLIQSHRDDLIRSVLLRKGYPIASAPDHVIRALQWGNIQTKRVTPEVVRKAIKGDPLDWMNYEEKLHLLEYILDDKQFHDLHSIQLLPLEDGTFTTFTTNAATVYIPTDDIPSELFPNMSNRFIAKKFRLLLADSEDYTQLRGITQQMVPSLLKEALPKDWVQGKDIVNWIPEETCQPNQEWLENIWTWLSRYSMSVQLTSYSSLPLVQYNVSNGCHRLARLYTHPIIFQQKPGSPSQLPATMSSYLETLDVNVIRNTLPEFITRHPRINEVIQNPNAEGVITVLQASWSKQAILNVSTGDTNLKRDIHDFFKHAQLSSQSKTLLHQLPIFATTDNNYVSVSQIELVVPSDYYGIPITRLKESIIMEPSIVNSLAIKLGACVITETDLVCDYILPDINTTHSNELNNIMRWVLKRPKYDSVVQNVCFIPNDNGLSRPIDLFPTDDEHLEILFKGFPVFPVDEYASEPSLSFLKRVGMRSSRSVTALELLTIASQVTELQDREVATELLQHVVHFPYLLTKQVQRNRIQKPLGKYLQDRAWVPCATDPPTSYPESLTWYEETTHLVHPGDAVLIEYADLVGSVKPLVKANRITRRNSSDELISFFGWGPPDPNKYATVELVVNHLQNVANSFRNERDIHEANYRYERYIQSVSRLSETVYKFLNRSPARHFPYIVDNDHQSSFVPIWHGRGFTAPEKIAFSSGAHQVNLTPYLYILPSTMKPYQNFLKAVGVKQRFDKDALNDVLHIIQDKHQTEVSTAEQQTDLKLVCDILNSIIASPDCSFSDVLVPCRKQQQDMENSLKLAKSQDCLYIDNERLMDEYIRSGCDIPVVHEMVPNQTAKRLGIRPLSHYVEPVFNLSCFSIYSLLCCSRYSTDT